MAHPLADPREAVARSPGGVAAWFEYAPTLAAVAALNAYGLLVAFPSLDRPRVPLAAPCAALAFAALQLAFPRCRPSSRQVISPANWALFAFFLQLVVLPLLVCTMGPVLGTLPSLPAVGALDLSIALSVVAFAAYCAGFSLAARRARDTAPELPAARLPGWIILMYAVLGSVGLLLAFGSMGRVFATLAEPSRFADVTAEQEGTLRGAASTFLRPFLLCAIVMAWCRWLGRRGAAAPWLVRVVAAAVAGVAVATVGATYSFNRAAFMVPLVAMAAAYSIRVRRLSVRAIALLVLVLGALAVVPGAYRSGDLTAAELARNRAARKDMLVSQDLGAQLQVYGNAPQFAGYLLEAAAGGQERFGPGVLVGSLLSPVPIVGKAFRDRSGPAAYNRLIYGNTGIQDQIIPFEGEVYLCLGPLGLVAAFVLVGVFISWLQRAFARAPSAFDGYALQFTATWVVFLVQGSLSAVAQVFTYFLWPIYGYALLRLHGRALRAARRG